MSTPFVADLHALRGFGELWTSASKLPHAVAPLEQLLSSAKPLGATAEERLLYRMVRREARLLAEALAVPEVQRKWESWSGSPEVIAKKDPPPRDPAAVGRAARSGASALERLGVARVHRAGFLRHVRPTTDPDDAVLATAQSGLDDVVQPLVFHNLRFCLWATWIPGFSTRESLLLGVLGLVEALDRFDPGRVRLGTYAQQWIRARKTLASRRWISAIRDSAQRTETRMKVRSFVASVRETGGEPSVEQAVESVDGIDRQRLLEVYRGRVLGQRLTTSGPGGSARILDLVLEVPHHNRAEAQRLVDVWLLERRLAAAGVGVDAKVGCIEASTGQTDRATQLVELWLLVQNAIDTLPLLQQRIAKSRLGLEHGGRLTLSELGRVHGYSRERIRQLQEKAFDTIRSQIQASVTPAR